MCIRKQTQANLPQFLTGFQLKLYFHMSINIYSLGFIAFLAFCFHVPVGHLYVFFWKRYNQVLCLFFFPSDCFFALGVLYTFFILTPYQTHSLQVFSPILLVAFSFCRLLFFLCRSFLVWCRVPHVSFCFVSLVGVISKKSLPRPMSRSHFLMFSSSSLRSYI